MTKIRVLVVDDAVVMRRIVIDVLSAEPDIEVVGYAPNGRIALAKIPQLNPDVVTLDMDMPEMDGLETLTAIRRTWSRLLVIMFGTMNDRGAAPALEALSLGASDYVIKPNSASFEEASQRVREELLARIRLHHGRFQQAQAARAGVRATSGSIHTKADPVRRADATVGEASSRTGGFQRYEGPAEASVRFGTTPRPEATSPDSGVRTGSYSRYDAPPDAGARTGSYSRYDAPDAGMRTTAISRCDAPDPGTRTTASSRYDAAPDAGVRSTASSRYDAAPDAGVRSTASFRYDAAPDAGARTGSFSRYDAPDPGVRTNAASRYDAPPDPGARVGSFSRYDAAPDAGVRSTASFRYDAPPDPGARTSTFSRYDAPSDPTPARGTPSRFDGPADASVRLAALSRAEASIGDPVYRPHGGRSEQSVGEPTSRGAGAVRIDASIGEPSMRAPATARIDAAGADPGTRLSDMMQRLESFRASSRIDVVAIGVSTGGPNALAELLSEIPAGFAVPILITQHMPPLFTRLLAERLDSRSPLKVQEAIPGTVLEPGHVWIAPGNHHMIVERDGNAVKLALSLEPPENSCRPSVDVLFRSVAQVYGNRTLALVLTGMGQDGLRGCELIRAAGGQILVQDESSSVVWGMPGYVARAGLAARVLPLNRLAAEVLQRVGAGRGGRAVVGAQGGEERRQYANK